MIDASSQTDARSSERHDDIFERLVKRVLKDHETQKPLWGKNMFLRRGLRYRRLRYKQSLQQKKKRD
jgi:hypothetical protein